jgi:uncharacterized protein YndB with AHSA1/START domain
MTADAVTATVHVEAPPEVVFDHFCSARAMTRWMGQWAELDPVPGGRFAVDIEGVAVRGRFVELDPPRRLLISWGHAGSDRLPPGASTVEVLLTPEAGGTRVEIHHRGLPEPEASRHPAGWRRFLAQLASTAARGPRGDGGGGSSPPAPAAEASAEPRRR